MPKNAQKRVFFLQFLAISNQRYVWVTWPERPMSAKHKVKGQKDRQQEVRAQRAPSLLEYTTIIFMIQMKSLVFFFSFEIDECPTFLDFLLLSSQMSEVWH